MSVHELVAQRLVNQQIAGPRHSSLPELVRWMGAIQAQDYRGGLWAAGLPREEQGAWRDFADELGMLFQVVDDILDEDGYVLAEGVEAARMRANRAAERALALLLEVPADTAVLAEIVNGLAVRTA